MFKLAWRNLWRNRTRTLIIGSAIIFSYALMLVSLGVSDDVHRKMMDAAAEGVGGEVLVHGDGWWQTQSSDIVIENPTAVREALKNVQGVDAVIGRVIINGLLTTSRGNEAARLVGVDLEAEKRLKDPTENLISGEFFSDEFDAPIVLSAKLADRLGAERGDKIVLSATTPQGEMTRALFHLDGIIESAGLGEMVAYTTISAAQKAVTMPAQLTQLGILSAPGIPHAQLATRARAALADYPVEVLTWEQAAPEMVGFIQLDDAFGYLYMIVVFIVVIFAIANTFLMAVMERVREFGLLNAIGLTPKRVGMLMMWETALLASISMLIGFALGFALHSYIAHIGIDLAALSGTNMEVAGVNMTDMIMRSQINPLKWMVATAAVFISVMLSAAYPAWRATKMAPAEAMRFYE